MDSATKVKDHNCNTSATVSAMAGMCSSDSFSIFPPTHHDLTSTNSIELNAAASLSDDSGVPLTTNSSISSGDSYKLGICKFEIELVESDGEVSQFDSLDNCSEGGMSAENFNTLKKGPLAPIDPPPEFQDSPQTTLARSKSNCRVGNLRRWTSSQSSFEHLKENANFEVSDINTYKVGNGGKNADGECVNYQLDEEKPMKESYAMNKHLYSSDSILNLHTDNLYDEPNHLLSSSLGNSIDGVESDSPPLAVPPPPPPVSIIKIKQTMCPYFQDHTRYFKAIPSEQDYLTTAANRFNASGLSEIHDYDLYYGIKRNVYQQFDSTLQRKVMYSPHHCHNHVYHAGMCANRPNSRNSLNSRLSSSHNSLSVSSTNKPDDSIFITQAMSHDALLTREISDFYNVPLDSDIYAFPVDMIKTDKPCTMQTYIDKHSRTNIHETKDDIIFHSYNKQSIKCPHQHKANRKNKHKRKKRSNSNCLESNELGNDGVMNNGSINQISKYTTSLLSPFREHDGSTGNLKGREPLHMTLTEVKQFYHTLYSDTKPNGGGIGDRNAQISNASQTKSSNETIWSGSTMRSRSSNPVGFGTIIDKTVGSMGTHVRNHIKHIDISENDKTNNNIISVNNHNNLQISQSPHMTVIESKEPANVINTCITKQSSMPPSEKRSQFSLNLKQKFCSIFRFRKSQNRYRSTNNESDDNNISHENVSNIIKVKSEDKRKKFQSRALPPLPKKPNEQNIETRDETLKDKGEKNNDSPNFQFTSSIEKVKDYGWYWGPLSSEAAEKVLSNEPDGSFIVRDSSDDHYIFSLSFKLNNCVRHVRIEQDQGTFSFGSYAKFKSQTITEFIEKAVEHSRSGRYLFFLHRRPEHGPMRVQLTNPVSRFKHVQSLQHMCRYLETGLCRIIL
ncbi:probable serine/threonine-protein kinase DDB_G0282963 isoform X2 [Glossina fuscipes]|uniref:Probable serine/threonine-protein kinase DDB_G0282963 isoform X2 n=1 Tax=Glossina fuscipes TaxID=7396 RepID=A0A9C5YXJ6_9MUSC|nr:probable serine/threonine-protein kinase DDB_G0282963 isoform X2 [Glossina fuscipes]